MMDDRLKKLMEKHAGKHLDPMAKEAKMSMLKELQSQMKGMIGEGLDKPGMKKVEVAADDKEGLVHGLDKAKELVGAADHASNDDQLGQDEADEHDIDTSGPWGVDPEMEESAEEGDSMKPEHEGEMDHSDVLSDEERALLEKLLAKARR